jgi:hypothetical protein
MQNDPKVSIHFHEFINIFCLFLSNQEICSTLKRVAIISARLRGLSYQHGQQGSERKFRKPASTRANTRLLVNRFKGIGIALDEQRSGRPQTSEGDAGRIQQATEQSPRASVRCLSNQLGELSA